MPLAPEMGSCMDPKMPANRGKQMVAGARYEKANQATTQRLESIIFQVGH